VTAYRTTQDIVIPAGTILDRGPARREYSDHLGHPASASGFPAHFVEATLGHGPDAISTWSIHIDDGLLQGLIEEAPRG